MKSQIEIAKEIATKAHQGQFRWGGEIPYIVHPAAVAKAVSERQDWPCPSWENERYRENAVAAAWLHDIIEDTYITYEDLVGYGVNTDVIRAVKLLTKSDDEDYLTYLLRIKYDDDIARIVKIEDIKNNMSDLDKKRKKSMYEKYQLALHILRP